MSDEFFDPSSDSGARSVRTDRDPTPSFSHEETKSKFTFVSIGRVADNKRLDSDIVEVYIGEQLPFIQGEVTSQAEDYKAKGENDLGESYNDSIKSTVTVEAQWLAFGESNRLTSPDVRRGERVMVCKYADADKYYWFKFGNDNDLRKLETIVWGISAHKEEESKLGSDNSYYAELSSHKKHFRFHMSKVNGEKVTYDLEMNPGKGHVLLTDDIGNWFSIDSTEHRIEMMNTDGCHHDMHKRNLTITVPDTYTLNARQVIINSITNDQNASAWHTTNSPLISHSASGAGGRCVSRACQIETTTMDFPDGHIIEETQNRIVHSDKSQTGPTRPNGGGSGFRTTAFGANSSPDPNGSDIWNGRTAATVGGSPVGRDLGDPEVSPNQIITVAKERLSEAIDEIRKVKGTTEAFYGEQKTNVDAAWTLKAEIADIDNPLHVTKTILADQDITGKNVYGDNVTYKQEDWGPQNEREAASILGLKDDIIRLEGLIATKKDA